MKRIFVTMLLSFLLSMLTFLSIMAGIFYIGYRKSISGWGYEKKKTFEEQIQIELKDILSQEISGVEAVLESRLRVSIPYSIPVTVYSPDKKVLYKHGGAGPKGRRRTMNQRSPQSPKMNQPMVPVQVNGEIVGFYSIGSVAFGRDSANAQFLNSMRRTVWISIACAFVLAFFFALLMSKKLSDSAETVADGIKQMALGKLSVKIPESGVKEISLIARSANELGEKLAAEETLRRQWAADIAHDLRTPIAALKSQFEGMIDGVLELTRDRIAKNSIELSRIETLINDLGELTRLESPEIRIHRESIDADLFFKELNNRFEHEFEKNGLSVMWEKGVDTFTGDEDLVLRAVSNFISNAIRHTPEGGKIRIAIDKNGKDYTISVFNSGEGIPREEIAKVFDRLYRGEYARKTPGSGLGLTISQKIAELHAGKVTIKSSNDHGTTVEMRI